MQVKACQQCREVIYHAFSSWVFRSQAECNEESESGPLRLSARAKENDKD